MKRLRRLLICGLIMFGALVFTGAVLFGFRAPLCRVAGKCWTVDDQVASADAAVVLGGGLESRPFAAARLFHEGRVGTILVPITELSRTVSLGLMPSAADVTVAILTKEGVPPSAITRFGVAVTSTRDEAAALKAWSAEHPMQRVIIPTDYFHTRRARWVFQRTLAPSGVAVHVHAVAPPGYTLDDWWRHEDGVVAFPMEVLKMAFYWFRF